MGKFSQLSMREILVVTSAYVRVPVQTLEEGEGSPQTTQPSFLGRKSHDHRRF